VGLSINLKAQIEKEISSFVDSTEMLVNNGRRLLLQSIKSNDLNKVNEIYLYLTNISLEKNCFAFGYIEELYINSLISDWDKWIDLAKNVSNEKRDYCFSIDIPLGEVLYNQIIENIDILLFNSDNLTNEERQLIDIYIHLLKYGNNNESYKSKIKRFRQDYKNSKFEYFVNNVLPNPKIKASTSFSLGVNSMILTNELANSFSPEINFYMAFDFNIDRVYASIFVAGADMIVKKEFSQSVEGNDVTFKKGDYFNLMEYGLHGGYFVIRNNRLHLAPIAAISGTYIKSDIFDSKEDKEDKEFKAINAFTCGLGMHSEIKVFEWKSKSYNYNNSKMNSLSLKFNFGYNYYTSHTRDMFKGSSFYFRPSLVWVMGDF
jgi:hypothetical protein